MAEHLQDSTGTSRLVHHQDGEEHEAAVRYGRVGVNILQVCLYTSREGTVDNGDTCQYQEYPAEFLSSFRHQIHGDTETTVTTKFHQYTCMEHTYGSRRRSVTVGAPCVEREQCTEYTETEESKREPNALLFDRNIMQLGNFQQVHTGGTGTEIDTQNTNKQECGTTHQHQCQFHGRVFLTS